MEEINYTVHQYIPVGVVTFQRYSTKQKLPFEAFVLQDLKHFVRALIGCDRLGSREAPSMLPKNVNNKPVSGSEYLTVECGSGRRFISRHKCPDRRCPPVRLGENISCRRAMQGRRYPAVG